MDTPKVFISYSWHPKENQIRVQQLAERLSSDGVHVIIDIWDLQDGQDKNKFMEQMVTNPEVKKVLLICTKEYTQKANDRKGGVGIESTIVSEEIYSNADQTKFIPVVYEYENDKPCVPVFAKSRVFIDLSSDEKFEGSYDQLLRDIYDKPRFQRPPIGKMPSYLAADDPVMLPTSNKVKGIKSAIMAANPNTHLLIRDYLDLFLSSLVDYKIDYYKLNENNFVEIVEQGINEMLPLKNDFLDFIQIVAGTQYLTNELLSDFFERMLQFYADNDINLDEENSLGSVSFDNYRYFNHDLFLSVVTILLSKELFDMIHELVSHHFCIIEGRRMSSPQEVSFMSFRKYNYTLNQYKNDIRQLHRVSVVADTMKQNAVKVRFDDMVRADLLLYYLSLIYPNKSKYEFYWYPELSIYNQQFIILPKLASLRYFNKAKDLFGVSSVEQYKNLVSSIKEPERYDVYHNIPLASKGLSVEEVGTIS